MTWEDARVFLEAVISILAIVNPIGNLPVFVGLIEDFEPSERRRMLNLAGITAFIIVVVMAVGGQFLLKYVFHISMTEFTFGGGLILIVVGIRSILVRDKGRKQPAEKLDPQTRKDEEVGIAVSPIASPLLVGPGTIVTVMLISQRDIWFGLAAALVAFAVVMTVLNLTQFIYRVMGRVGTLAVGRIMQIFIVAIGCHFVLKAIMEFFPELAR